MRIILFSAFGYDVYSHGVFLVLGIVIAAFLHYRLLKKEQIKVTGYLKNIILSVILAIISSRIAFYLLNLNLFDSPYQTVKIWEGGLVSFAGFVTGCLIFYYLTKKEKNNIEPIINLAGVAFPLGIAIGRIGCALNGEVGIKSDSTISYYGYVPVTAIEIFSSSLIFIINFYLYLKLKNKLPKYSLFLTFVALYSLSRTIIDYWRVDEKIIFNLNNGQFFSVIVFIISILILFKKIRVLEILNDFRRKHER